MGSVAPPPARRIEERLPHRCTPWVPLTDSLGEVQMPSPDADPGARGSAVPVRSERVQRQVSAVPQINLKDLLNVILALSCIFLD